jgi:hypothetical protein
MAPRFCGSLALSLVTRPALSRYGRSHCGTTSTSPSSAMRRRAFHRGAADPIVLGPRGDRGQSLPARPLVSLDPPTQVSLNAARGHLPLSWHNLQHRQSAWKAEGRRFDPAPGYPGSLI